MSNNEQKSNPRAEEDAQGNSSSTENEETVDDKPVLDYPATSFIKSRSPIKKILKDFTQGTKAILSDEPPETDPDRE